MQEKKKFKKPPQKTETVGNSRVSSERLPLPTWSEHDIWLWHAQCHHVAI